MKTPRAVLTGLAVLIMLAPIAGCIIPLVRLSREDLEGMTWSITLGKDRCHLVKLPAPWPDLDNGTSIYIGTPYEFKKVAGSATRVFMGVREKNPIGRVSRSPKKYGVDLVNAATVWAVSEAEFEKAISVPVSEERCFPKGWGEPMTWDKPMTLEREIQLFGRQTCRCDGKEFPKSGKWDAGSVFSSMHRWLAVTTWNGHYNGSSNRQIGQPLDAFVDVYRLDTGEKAVALKAHVGGSIDLGFFDGIRWLSDDFLVIPVHQYLQEVLVCDLRENTQKAVGAK